MEKQDQKATDAVTVVVKNTKGPGELLLMFADQKVTDATPVRLFEVLGGGKRPESLVQVTAVARGFDPDKVYNFHIHESAITVPGDCASTKDHWDPLQAHPRFRGGKKEDYKPTPGNWSSYELGDLSGKYGAINGDAAANATPAKLPLPNFVSRQKMQQSDNGNATTVEGYVVLDPTLTKVADFAKLSVVLHNAAGERVGCSNLSPREFLAGLQTAEAGKDGKVPPNVLVQDAAVKEAEDKQVVAAGTSGAAPSSVKSWNLVVLAAIAGVLPLLA
ncbi:hypothetical protein BCR44DRAFT_1434966 [Catenaria anguillulae PL171]|uniref:Uncharacterized protein n=1 Tax=Catenaria anguillulae PL171 TaxID=765915 RepID=A0A1Y2HKF6_9FUNG|nr:hypothetical protein BCR44DRAFT_1434966 [Catenaria anguillulae PL171]